MFDLSVKYNELTAEQFIELWETVWGDGPTLEQTELVMKHTLFTFWESFLENSFIDSCFPVPEDLISNAFILLPSDIKKSTS